MSQWLIHPITWVTYSWGMPNPKAATLLAFNLKRLRTRKGITGDELAEKASLSGDYVRQLETCRKWASAATLDRLAKALKAPLHELFLPRRR